MTTDQPSFLVVISPYDRRMNDELTIKPGEKIRVIEDDSKYNDGWYLGKNVRTGEEGLFPKNFTRPWVDQGISSLTPKSQKRMSGFIEVSSVTHELENEVTDAGAMRHNSSHHNSFANKTNKSTNQGSHTGNTVNDTSIHQQNSQGHPLAVAHTISDIDRALEELQNDSLELLQNSGGFEPRDTSSLDGDSTVSKYNTRDATASSSLNTSQPSSNINVKIHSLDPSYVIKWTPRDVAQYFSSKGFDSETVGHFVDHKINGKILLELEVDHLRECGITSFGTRFEIYRQIEMLKSSVESYMYTKRKLKENSSMLLPALSLSQSERDDQEINVKNDATTSATATISSGGSRSVAHKSSTQFSPKDQDLSMRLGDLALSMGKGYLEDPGAAPKPPSYPSPVNPPVSPVVEGKQRFLRDPFLHANLQTSQEYRHSLSLDQSFISDISDSTKPPSGFDSERARRFSATADATRPHTGTTSSGSSPTPSHGALPGQILRTASDNTAANPSKRGSLQTKSKSERTGRSGKHKTIDPGNGSFMDLYNRISMLSPDRSEPKQANTPSPITKEFYDVYKSGKTIESNCVSPSPTTKSPAALASARAFNNSKSPSSAAHTTHSGLPFSGEKRHRRVSSVLSFFPSGKTDSDSRATSMAVSPLSNTHTRNGSVQRTTTPSKSKSGSYKGWSSLASTPKTKGVSRSSSTTSSVSTREKTRRYSEIRPPSSSYMSRKTTGSSTSTTNTSHTSGSTDTVRHTQLNKAHTPKVSNHKRKSSIPRVTRTTIDGSTTVMLSPPNNSQTTANTATNGAVTNVTHTTSRSPHTGTDSQATKVKGNTLFTIQNRKQKTSAFQEGLRNITVERAMKEADCSGWMRKKGSGAMGVWKMRFFTLHGTRLSYFGTIHDTRERGLIDITGYRVLPASDDDKFASLYATSMGRGRYCFKLVPPQPGSKKGLTFTQQRVHYFAVDSKEDMRSWLAALIKASIEIDDSVPVISSYAMPTVSLSRAREMLDQARKEMALRDEKREEGEDEDQLLWEQQQKKNQTVSSGFI